MISVEKGNLIYLQAESTEAMNFTLYFADVFEPLNILDKDGNKYNVIPTLGRR